MDFLGDMERGTCSSLITKPQDREEALPCAPLKEIAVPAADVQASRSRRPRAAQKAR